jgi:hypothetical protein
LLVFLFPFFFETFFFPGFIFLGFAYLFILFELIVIFILLIFFHITIAYFFCLVYFAKKEKKYLFVSIFIAIIFIGVVLHFFYGLGYHEGFEELRFYSQDKENSKYKLGFVDQEAYRNVKIFDYMTGTLEKTHISFFGFYLPREGMSDLSLKLIELSRYKEIVTDNCSLELTPTYGKIITCYYNGIRYVAGVIKKDDSCFKIEDLKNIPQKQKEKHLNILNAEKTCYLEELGYEFPTTQDNPSIKIIR